VQRLVAENRCVQCRAGLLEYEKWRCDDCKAKNKKKASRKKIRARYAKRARLKYWRDPAAARAKQNEYRRARQYAGTCRHCPKDALPDSDFCRHHRHLHRQRSRASMQRLRARRAGGMV
jgi:hypothetical protein